ncbi:Carbon catabolite repressor protein 4 homolog 4 (CCR4 homolog 4) (Protein HESPERIN) (AtHESP) (AtHesperin), partial [Durusdinium trenchii]
THTPFERRHHASGEFPGSERHGGDRRSDWRLEVATSHLYWDPRFPDLKLLQAFLLDQELSDFTGGLILAGDLNSTPLLDGRSSGEGVLSGVYQLLTQGDVEVLHPHHPVQMRPKVGILKGLQPQDVPEFRISPYRSAAVEARGAEAATNASADFVGCLDYILYKGPQLRLVGATWPDAATLPGGVLPSEEQPSDHLPLLAVFELGDEQGCLTYQTNSALSFTVPEIADLHLEPSLFPAILGFFTYTVGKAEPFEPFAGGAREVFLLWGASLASGFSATPVGKVVEMLQDMKSEGEKAKKDEKVQFAAYKQFCETTEAQKVRVIQDAKDKVEVLTAQVEKGESDASKLAEEIAEHTKDLESASAEKEALVAARSKEREAFDSMLQDYVESIEAIGRALKELKANTAKNEEGALVQLSALKLPDKASRGLQVLMADNFEDKLLSFLGEETGSVATRQSGGIVDMLEKLEEKFMDERLEIEKEETAKRHAHELLAQSLTRKAEEAGKEKQQKETLKAKKLQEKASAAGDLSETEVLDGAEVPLPSAGHSGSELPGEEQATLPEIKKAYKDLSRRHHPDKSQDPNATARFQRIAEAYQELKDQERRLSVDDWMARHVASSSSLELVRIELNVVGRLEPLMPALGSGYHLFRSPTCGVVLIVAPAGASLEAGRQRLRECIDELTGLRAPPGGLIFIVPSNRLDVVPRMVLALPQLLWQFGASISQVAHDRIVARGPATALPAAVQQLQWWMDFYGLVQLPDGQQLDAWQYAHACELHHIQGLAPMNREPDAAESRSMMEHVLQLSTPAQLTLVELAVRCLQSNLQFTTALARSVSSGAVYAEYSEKSGDVLARARLACAFASLASSSTSIARAVVNHRIANDAQVQTMMRLGPFLDSADGLFLRSRGFIAAKDAVPSDGQWHQWEELLRPKGSLAMFWQHLCKVLPSSVILPVEWHEVPEVMTLSLKHCLGSTFEVDTHKGLRKVSMTTMPGDPVAGDPSVGPVRLVEEVEDQIFELKLPQGDSASLDLVQRKHRSGLGDQLDRTWYEQHRHSFELVESESVPRVRLTPSARERAELRSLEREREKLRMQERRVAEAVLAELSPRLQDLPRSCEGKELAALLIALQHRASRCDTQKTAASSSEAEALQLPGALPVIVKRLMERAHERRTTGGGKHVLAAELLEELHPFNAAQVTGAIVSLHSPTSPLENQALVMLMQAAACDMHEAFDGPVKSGGACWAPLQVVRDSVLSAGRRPFLDVFQERKTAQDKLLVASAALRVSIELFDKKKACPVCLSPGYSSFEPFAGLCAALANLYKLVSPFIEEHIELVTEAFEKLAAACEHLALGDAAREPSGLARLADAFATLTFSRAVSPSQRFVAAAQRGLAQVSKVLVATDMREANGWNLLNLATIAACYASGASRSAVAATRTDEELFTKLAAAANLSSEKLKREVVLKMISSFYQAGFLKKLEQFLKGLAAKSWFQENVADSEEKDIPSLVASMMCAASLAEVEKRLPKDRPDELLTSTMVSIVKELGESTNIKAVQLTSTVLKMLVAAKGSGAELEKALCDASASSLRRAWCTRSQLESLPRATAGWPDLIRSLERLLSPFTGAQIRVPRMEAACAGRFMEALQKTVLQSEKHDSHVLKHILTAGLLFSPEAFASMPSLVETLAICLKHLVSDCLEAERMKALVQKMMPSESSSSPSELQSWTELLEGIIMDGKICKQWDEVEMMIAGSGKERLQLREIQDALGQSWLSILLARSQKLSWMGGRAIRAHPARVRAALRELGLKMEKAGIPMAKVTSLQPEEEPPVPQVQGPKPRSRSRSTKDGVITVSNCSDPRLGLTLEGQYARDGTNHNKAVYRRIEADPKGSHLPIKLYYWDDRDGKENQGWWFGPTVGGEEVWLHNPRALHFPPADGWDFSLKVALNHRAPAAPKGKAKAKATAPPAAASSAAPSTVDPPAKAAKKARLSEESEEDGFPELTRWLRSLAPSNPHQLMKYYSALVTHFEGDLQQIAAAKIGDAERDGVKRVEPAFWEAIGCTKAGDKLRLAKGIAQLPD